MKKLLTTTALSILLVSLASGVYGQPSESVYYDDGSFYIGETRAGNRTVQGTYTWAGGRAVYVGEFSDNKPNGQGTKTNSDGSIYVGEFRDGRLSGQATYTSADGSVYVGEFRDGRQSGQGTKTYSNGNVYVGRFRNGYLNGQGKITYADGSTRTGVWGRRGNYLGTQAQFDQSERERKAREEIERVAIEAREEIKRVARKKYEAINNACLLDKSQNVDMQVSSIRRAVEEICEAIAEDPSWWNEFKYN
jgi:hypothetical protein